MNSRAWKLRIWGVLGLLLALVVMIGYGEEIVPARPVKPPPRTPEQTGALQWFIEKLKPCFEIAKPVPYTECTFPAGFYCLYYTEDPVYKGPQAYHTFGWYSETVGCGALYPIVRGQTYDRCNQDPIPGLDPASVLPCMDGWGLWIPEAFGKIGFWLNNPYPPKGRFPITGGHYFTCTPRNWDGLQHAYIYMAMYVLRDICETGMVPVKCRCDCGCILPPRGTMYLIFWENWCNGGDWDWNDFMVAIIPCIIFQ